MPRHYPLRVWSSTALAISGTIESGVIDLRFADPEGMTFTATGTGTADVKLEYCISEDGTTFNSYTSQQPITSSTNTDFAAFGPEEAHMLNIPWAPFVKFRVTEVSASVTDTAITANLWMRE